MGANDASNNLSSLHPGRRIDLILSRTPAGEPVDLRSTAIYRISRRTGRMILAQTDPFLDSAFLGKEIEVTFVDRSSDPATTLAGPVRVGFRSRLLEVDRVFLLNNEQKTPCIVLSVPDRVYPLNLRGSLRVFPLLNRNIVGRAASLGRRPGMPFALTIINLSRTGVQASFPEGEGLTAGPGDTVALHLSRRGGRTISLTGRVVWTRQRPGLRPLRLMGLEFLDMGVKEMRFLNDYVIEMERIELRRRAGLA